MTWVRFTANFDFSPAALGGLVTLAYTAGTVDNVTRECAQKAIAAGKAVADESLRPRSRQCEDPGAASKSAGRNAKGGRGKR
jgi:hypothetical protein